MNERNEHRWHDDLLVAIARSFPAPPVYVEIGVFQCECFNKVAPYTAEAHAVDPSEHALALARGPRVRRHEMSSDEFFADFREPVDLVFVDGDHHYEVARRDFYSAAEILRRGGTIAVHDVWPETSWNCRLEACGDVWMLAAELAVDPDWRTYIFPTFPGLLLCQRTGDENPQPLY